MTAAIRIACCWAAAGALWAAPDRDLVSAPLAPWSSRSPAGATVTSADCSAARLGESIPASSIGEPVGGVSLAVFRWTQAAGSTPAYCVVDGSIAPVDRAAPAINFRVLLPSDWSRRAVQVGAADASGSIPNLAGGDFPIGGTPSLRLGFAKYGSDSGHRPGSGQTGWMLNDEALRNFGYQHVKKTHDAAMVVIERMYGERPRFNYFTGASEGGREALTAAQRYPADYDGIAADVPLVGYSSLVLAPALIRLQEAPMANWVPPVKVNAIRGEFMRRCDALDGLVDGRIENYLACRAIFDVSEGAPSRPPWDAMRCPHGFDPEPMNVSSGACLTDGQIRTLEFVYSRLRFAAPPGGRASTFGMWVPNTDPAGGGLIVDVRYKGQEGAAAAAPAYSRSAGLGAAALLFRNPRANPLEYVPGSAADRRHAELSAWLDATNPDLTAFARRGGRMIVTIGTNDTQASPGEQVDYYQSVLGAMGRPAVDAFARLFVIPQVDHALIGASYPGDGPASSIAAAPIPSRYDRFGVLIDWVERHAVPAKHLKVTADRASMPLCSYPAYPRYVTGPINAATSYTCAE